MDEPQMSRTTWWVLFPFKGLDINDPRHDLNRPIWGDATVLSKRHIGQIVPLLKINERTTIGHDHERDVIYLLEHATFDQDFQSFIAVCRSSPEDRVEINQIIEKAHQRAERVAALLAVAFLAHSKWRQTCGLVEQFHRRVQNTAMVDIKKGNFAFVSLNADPVSKLNEDETIPTSRKDLRAMFAQRDFRGLYTAIALQKPTLSSSLSNAIAQASIRLSNAVYSPTLSGQVLGAVTSIEILLSNQGDSYDTIAHRVTSLLGSKGSLRYDVDAILRARHLYVHKGEEVSEFEIPVRAIGLALACLLSFANLAHRFESKDTLLPFLDVAYKIDTVSAVWSSQQSKALAQVLKHRDNPIEFPFMTNLVKAV